MTAAEPAVVALVGGLPGLALAQRRVGLGHLDEPAQDEVELDRHRLLAPQRAVVVEHRHALLDRDRLDPSAPLTRATKSTIACFAGPSRQLVSAASQDQRIASSVLAMSSAYSRAIMATASRSRST